MKKISVFFIFTYIATVLSAQNISKFDLNKPFGWAICTSLTESDYYELKGGGNGSNITLLSNNKDMMVDIMNAVNKYDIIIFDGSQGEFIISSSIRFTGLANKTILGINNATIRTQFVLTPEIHKLLHDKKVEQTSTSANGTIYKLSNGHTTKEQHEYLVRQTLIDFTGSQEEKFREAGLFSFNNCENIIIRNLTLKGPGGVDVGGSDLLTLSHNTKHVWVDHCEFIDGMDGNFDINSFSDFITVSWCRFRYTDKTFDHSNTNLIGSNDRAEMNGEDNLNVTFYACNWDKGCNQRMPMVRFGNIHLLNNLYTCIGNYRGINPRYKCEMLVEGNYFSEGVKSFTAKDAKAYSFVDNISKGEALPEDFGNVRMPYKYKAMPVSKVKKEVSKFCGATLENEVVLQK